MKIIALKGKDKTGKSLTLETLLFRLLKNNCISATGFIYENQNDEQNFEYSYFEDEIKQKNQDLILTGNCEVPNYTVRFIINGLKFGLTTYGDNERLLKIAFKYFADCDIVICATRTKGSSYRYLEELKEDVVLISKIYINDNRKNVSTKLYEFMKKTNETQVDLLLELLDNVTV